MRISFQYDTSNCGTRRRDHCDPKEVKRRESEVAFNEELKKREEATKRAMEAAEVRA